MILMRAMHLQQKVRSLRSASTINRVKRSKFEIISKNYISDNGRLTNANASFDISPKS